MQAREDASISILRQDFPFERGIEFIHTLSDGINDRQWQLLSKRDNFALFLPRDWLWSPQSKEPLGL